MEPKDRIVFALDVSSLEEVDHWTCLLKGWVGTFKVGKELFLSAGPKVIEAIRERGIQVFLDLKFHDIPNTVAGAVREAARLGVRMLTIHTLGGLRMMERAREVLEAERQRPLLLGVTVLTSLGRKDLEEVGIEKDPEEEVLLLSRLAGRAGLDGVVASPLEVEAVRKEMGKGFLIVTPGIRPSRVPAKDQVRVATPREAIERGSDYLVVGRPIREAKDPLGVVRSIITEIEGLGCQGSSTA